MQVGGSVVGAAVVVSVTMGVGLEVVAVMVGVGLEVDVSVTVGVGLGEGDFFNCPGLVADGGLLRAPEANTVVATIPANTKITARAALGARLRGGFVGGVPGDSSGYISAPHVESDG